MRSGLNLQLMLICLFLLGVSVLIGLALRIKTTHETVATEGFVDSDILLQACPSGTQMFTKEGKTLCCDGDVVGGECNGNLICSLSSDSPELPSCVNRLRADFAAKSARYCPRTIPNYFERTKDGKVIRGCTNGQRTMDGGSSKNGTKTCVIYATEAENRSKLDSCSNIQLQDTTVCPQGGKPSLVSLRADAPVVLQCSVQAMGDPYPHICYEDKTFQDYLNTMKTDWKTNMSFDENLSFCSKANDYYIKKTLVRPIPPPPVPAPAASCPAGRRGFLFAGHTYCI